MGIEPFLLTASLNLIDPSSWASAAELEAEAIRLGMQTLRVATLNRLKQGLTTLEEVTRVSARD